MKEAYLHYIWKTKSILFKRQKLINQEQFELIDPGFYNTESGPDFFNGSVKIDGVIWRGNIEIHINSSDWYAHNHQFADTTRMARNLRRRFCCVVWILQLATPSRHFVYLSRAASYSESRPAGQLRGLFCG